jgi:hypothetical protein
MIYDYSPFNLDRLLGPVSYNGPRGWFKRRRMFKRNTRAQMRAQRKS